MEDEYIYDDGCTGGQNQESKLVFGVPTTGGASSTTVSAVKNKESDLRLPLIVSKQKSSVIMNNVSEEINGSNGGRQIVVVNRNSMRNLSQVEKL